MAKELFEIKKDKEGFGILIERDSGYVDLSDSRNSETLGELKKIGSKDTVEIVDRMEIYLVLQKYGMENANGRIYPEKVLKSQAEAYQHKINNRQAYGESNHPESVTLNLDRLAMGITEMWWDKRTLMGKAELILSPAFCRWGIISCEGDRIANYIRLGWRIGVSSRGLGSVEQDKYTGKFIVQDDFELTCFDFVTDPSTRNAYVSANQGDLKQYVESKQTNKSKINEGLDSFLNKKMIL